MSADSDVPDPKVKIVCGHWVQARVSKDGETAYCPMTHTEQVSDDLEVCHTCDNPPCCNPTHLWKGTHQANMQDAREKGRLILPYERGKGRWPSQRLGGALRDL